MNNSENAKATLKSQYTYDEAKQFQQEKGYPYFGVIIDKGLCCIDIDHCVLEDGRFCQGTLDIIESFKNCYIEYSSSKKGIHIYFYMTQKQLKQLEEKSYRSRVEIHDGDTFGLEFYFKSQTRAIIFSGNGLNKEKEDHSAYVSNDTLFSFLDTYMKKENVIKMTDKSPSGEDFNRMCNCFVDANGDKKLTKELFYQGNPKKRRGPYKKKWENEAYIDRTFVAAKKRVMADLQTTCNRKPKNNSAGYLLFGKKFFESMHKDRQEFVRSKNYLYSFLRILWEVNRQYSETEERQNCERHPSICVDFRDLEKILDCSSYKKAIDILEELTRLGYLKYRGVYDLDITLEKFYAQDQKGNYTFQKNYVRVDKAIFEDYFLRAKSKCEKSDLLLYLYSNSEYCSHEEFCKRIRCLYTVAFGYRYSNTLARRQKRYDISEKELAPFLNIGKSTLCSQLKSLQSLHYIYISENGSRYNRGIFITLCNFDAFHFRKYGEYGEDIHKKAHQELRDCFKIRNRTVNENMKITADNFLNRKEDTKAMLENYDCAA